MWDGVDVVAVDVDDDLLQAVQLAYDPGDAHFRWPPGGGGLRPERPSPSSGGPRWRLGCGGRRGGLAGRACSSAKDCSACHSSW